MNPYPDIIHHPFPAGKKLKRILVIRLQATGDVIILLPYLQSLRTQLPPEVEMDFLVRDECKDLPLQLSIFTKVHILKGGRSSKKQLLHFFWLFPKLFLRRYDVLFDLQNHRLSKIIRAMLMIRSFCLFDRTSSNYAGDRYMNSINALKIARVKFEKLTQFRNTWDQDVFKKFGLDPQVKYVVINPAGAFKNRNWDLNNYVAFCKLWLTKVNPNARFLILGISKIKEQAHYLKAELGDKLINLVEQTSQTEAMFILRKVQLVVSEDSGLFHMSYVVGTPTIGIFGSTRNDWTNPGLPYTFCFHSSDLPCGNCMLETCIHSEILCLKRVQPQTVLQAATAILDQ